MGVKDKGKPPRSSETSLKTILTNPLVASIFLFGLALSLRNRISPDANELDVKFDALKQAVSEQRDDYIGMCVIAKDEHYGIVEWVIYHHMLGVSKFYLEDDDSEPHMEELLRPLIRAGLVEYHLPKVSKVVNRQNIWYNACLDAYRDRHRWLGVLDPDEFIVLEKAKSLQEFLKPFEDNYSAVVSPWRMFASSGYKTPPLTGVVASYTKCEPIEDKRVMGKPFSNTKYCWEHECHVCSIYTQGKDQIAASGDTVLDNGMVPMGTKGAVIHHYVQKSWEEFERKMNNGDIWPDNNRTVGRWNFFENVASETCTHQVALGTMAMKLMELYGLTEYESNYMKQYPERFTKY